MRDNHPILKTLLAILLTVALGVALDFYGALALMLGWNWFVVPATNFPTMSYGLGFGIILFVALVYNLITSSSNPDDRQKENVDSFGELFLKLAARAASIFLGITVSMGLMALVACIIH